MSRQASNEHKTVQARIRKVAGEFGKFPNWRRSEAEQRELRKQVTYAVFHEEEDLEKVTATVEALFTLLQKSYRP